MYSVAELSRKLENLILIGSIAEVDHANKTVVVSIGDDDDIVVTKPLPWPCEIGRNFISWRPLRVGTQVVLCCMSGDIANAVIVGMLYTQGINSQEQSETIDQIRFDDGTTVQYNSDSKTLLIHCVGDVDLISDSNIDLSAANSVNISAAQINISGAVTQTGGDMTSDGISAQKHVHLENGKGSKSEVPE